MGAQGDILDPSWMRLEGDFNRQVASLFSYVRLTRDQVESFRCLFSDVENTLRTQWPGCEVIPFGSVVTGMGIKTSDVDCYVYIPVWNQTPGDKYVITARNAMRRRSNIFSQLFAITSAKVPIVKFLYTPTGTHCDLSFKSPSGVRNSKLISFLLHQDRRALDLAILVKYWSKVHNLTGTNLVPNYALTLLVVFFLQQKEILPSVSVLQENVPDHLVDNWNTAFNEYPQPNNNDWSLLQLLGDFFTYYSTYNFEQSIISPYLGYSIVRDCFKKVSDIPEEFWLYRENLRKCGPLKLDTPMCVQDPFDHSRNCTVGVFFKLSSKLIAHFKLAATLYEKESSGNFLKALLMSRVQVNPVVVHDNRIDRVQNKIRKPHKPHQAIRQVKNLKQNIHNLYVQMSKQKNRGKR